MSLLLAIGSLLLIGCRSSPPRHAKAHQKSTVVLLYGDAGDVYMGGWAEGGRTITATSLREDQPISIKIDLRTRTAESIEIPLPGSWAGQWSDHRLLVESDASGDPELYVFDTDSGTVARLTSNPANEWHPSWDSSGNRVVFDSDRAGQLDLYVLNLDSGAVQRLTDDERSEQAGRLSPDGATLAFHRYQGPSELDYDIYLKALDEGSEHRLTDAIGDDSYPDWSPDGSLIAFSSNRNGDYAIYLMCTDGSGLTQLTDDSSAARYPQWSPDGQTIAFQSENDGRRALYLLQEMQQPSCPGQ